MTRPKIETRTRPLIGLALSYDKLTVMQLRRRNGYVICEIYNGTSSTLLEVPQYAYDAVAKGDFSTVGEIKEYIRKHPQPNLP